MAALLTAALAIGGPAWAEPAAARARSHVVRAGETLRSIAADYELTIDDLAAANELNPEQPLSVGRTLTLPRPGTAHFHVVRSGETAAEIARGAGCSVEELLRENDLRDAASLQVGQPLRLPAAPGPQAGSAGGADKAGRRHVVKAGESLNEIAHAYGVGTKVLARANKIRDAKALSPGRVLVIPDQDEAALRSSGHKVTPLKSLRRISGQRQGQAVIHQVVDGQTWSTIARAYEVDVPTLRKANPALGKRLVAGEAVRIPGKRTPVAVGVANCGYPGIRFVKRDQEKTIRLMGCGGSTSGKGRRQLSELTGSRNRSEQLSSDLLKRVQRIGDEFPGRRFHVVSGYRAPQNEREGSRHNAGRALDFSIEGVPNRALFEFCKTLPSTGCGFYPNSTFVHVDARQDSASWVDLAGPGEAPDYTRTKQSDDSGSDPEPVPEKAPGGNGS